MKPTRRTPKIPSLRDARLGNALALAFQLFRQRPALTVTLLAFTALFIAAAGVPYDRDALDFTTMGSTRIAARDGSPLRVTLGPTGTRAEWVPLERVSERVVQATLAAEDRRFYRHPGVDPVALLRATIGNVRARHVVGGGSTITQQLAGMLWPEPRSLPGKLREMVRAVRLERDLSKRAILEQYLNRLPYAPAASGIATASQALFGLDPSALSAGQAATLAALPQSPTRYARPAGRDALRRRRDSILRAMARQGNLAHDECAALVTRDLEIDPDATPFAAPHFADWVLATLPPGLQRASRVETTLDPVLQGQVEGIVTTQLEILRHRGVHEMAVVVQAVATGEILTLVGSPSWEDAQVNGALAARQPGSTLKPFVYAQAFAAGVLPADRLADIPLAFLDGRSGEVAPRNYDGQYHGPVRAREALASSFNVPAVRVQQQLGTERVLRGLRAAGFETLRGDSELYGLGLVLGVGEVTLLDLVNAYAGLARGGEWMSPVALRAARDAHGRRLAIVAPERRRWLDPASAFLVTDVLSDDAARVPGFGPRSVLDLPFAVAVKTGTSTDYRNSWCIGFTRDHVVGVWVGNFDATPIQGLAGAAGAGPVFRDVMLRLRERSTRPWESTPPPGWKREPICTLSGDTPSSACAATVLEWFPPGAHARRPACTFHQRRGANIVTVWPAEYEEWARASGLEADGTSVASTRDHGSPRILSPVDGSVYFCDPRLTASAIRFTAEAPQPRDVWLLDGRQIESSPAAGAPLWRPERGDHRLQLHRNGTTTEIRFSVR